MHSEYWFSELAQSLRDGFFSDAIVLEAARIAKNHQVNDDQRSLFRRAAEVLELAKEGSQWFDNPQMSENASRCASFFGQAVEAMTVVVTTESFVAEIDKLKNIAENIASGALPTPDELQRFRTFFFNTGRSVLQRTDSLMDWDKEAGTLEGHDRSSEGE